MTRLIFEPNVEIPAEEKWLWENEMALKQVINGLKDSATGKLKSRGDFKQFLHAKK